MTGEQSTSPKYTTKILICTRHGWAAGWEEHRSIQGILWALPDGTAPKATVVKFGKHCGYAALLRIMPGMIYLKMDLIGGFEAFRVRDIRRGKGHLYAEMESVERADVPEALKLAAVKKAEDINFLFARRPR